MKEAELNRGRRWAVRHSNGQFHSQRYPWTHSKPKGLRRLELVGRTLALFKGQHPKSTEGGLFHQNHLSNSGRERAMIERERSAGGSGAGRLAPHWCPNLGFVSLPLLPWSDLGFLVLIFVVLQTVSSFLYVKPWNNIHGVLIFMLNLATVYMLCVELHVKPCSNVQVCWSTP